ncbi:Crp/Fnr family transcriptional regulator [Flammeovirga sp. EKP202]|uniref:Crp/Fnr family transcriptional regulator n=1 Tax=Flammeovirga sp. EKP202 TaxID=2770592 RepID=UPI00165FEB65|nr:Crp/Fnr family transcriptional regulator [Flammeovirga sp. EKP202]MBD0399980.1 Crp/Fnr family transcriptional regulator [Flammeovirga sp. EKP202]
MRNVLSVLEKYYSLSDENKALIVNEMEAFRLKKGDVLIQELEKSPYMFFIEKGAVATSYIDEKGNKKVVWFGFESDICFSISAYIDVAYLPETIELLEDSQFYRVKISHVKALYQNHTDWANWGRSFIEHNFATTIKEMDEYKSRTAKERYQELIKHKPNVRSRVPLKAIASYLGVSPVTISRLRKEIKE